ncbi:MAG: ACR3 family arsenite efflux transporter [Gammaproteobacteria bacterium]|nr:ACR3 family arsenite efflux transporter [Gammaproteobacteria bacterium]
MGIFERWLTLWVLLCMVVGVSVGHFIPAVIHSLEAIEIAKVNIPVAILIWLMIIPMLISIDLKELVHVKQYWRGIYITLIINWLVKPFSMAFLGWFFLKHVFSDLLPSDQIDSYIAGLIILAAAPCTAMVFVWSNLCKGEPHFTLTQVALNDLIMIFAFAPIVGLLLGIANISVPWATLFYSVLIYIIIPFCIAQFIRSLLIGKNSELLNTVLKTLHPVSLIALLSMLILLFSFQGDALLKEPLVVFIIAVPILIQVYFNSMLAYYLNKITGEAFCVAGPSALIGASNFFELAVATAIILFGFKSGAALATVVGVLVEVPVMLSIVKIVNATKYWYEKKSMRS